MQVGVRDLQQKHLYCKLVDFVRVYEVDGVSCVVRSPIMLKLIDLGSYGVSNVKTPGDLLGMSNFYHLFRTAALLTSDAWDLYTWTKVPLFAATTRTVGEWMGDPPGGLSVQCTQRARDPHTPSFLQEG